MQRERLDEPGGVDLLDRDAPEGALVEVAELEHRGRAVDVEQVLEQRQPVAVRRQDDRVDLVPADDLGELVELAQHRHDRVRVVADEADELDTVRVARLEGIGEPRRFLARAQAEHPQRALGRLHAMPAHVPAGDREEADQGGGDEPERLGARVQQGCGGDDQGRDERGGLGMTDETNSQRAVVLAAVAQHRGADRPGDRRSRRSPRACRSARHRIRIPRPAASRWPARTVRRAPVRVRASASAASPGG